MEWFAIKGYEGLYEITKCGCVRSLDKLRKCAKNGKTCALKGRELKTLINASGYEEVGLCKEGIKRTNCVHRLLAENFLPKPADAECVNHINGIKTDNRLENLEWCSYSHNNKHAYDNKLKIPYDRRGSKGPTAILNETQVIEIKQMIENKVPTRIISEMYSMKKSAIDHIKYGTSWGWLKIA